MLTIRKAEMDKDALNIQGIIQLANMTVANDLNLTRENAPTSPAFIEIDNIRESFENGVEYYTGLRESLTVGCIAIEKDKKADTNYFIERLAVLPEHRHNGFGKELLDYAVSGIKKKNGITAGIAIINENTTLKNWYVKYGFKEIGLKKFDHLPFTVCFMNIYL